MTHEHIKALDELIAAVEGGIEWFDWLDHEEALPYEMLILARDANHGSLDAAKALHEALLPGCGYRVSPSYAIVIKPNISEKHLEFDAIINNNPARVWLIAILKAYRAQMEA